MQTKQDGRQLRAQKRREARRRQIMEAGIACFARKGYHETAIDDIIKESGIARGTFYAYFKGKQELFGAILTDLLERISDAIKPVVVADDYPPPEQQVLDNLTRLFKVFAEHHRTALILIRSAPGVSGKFDEQVNLFYERLAALIERTLRRGEALGLVRSVNHRVAAHVIIGGTKELITAELGGTPSPARIRKLAADMMDIVFAGLRNEVRDGDTT